MQLVRHVKAKPITFKSGRNRIFPFGKKGRQVGLHFSGWWCKEEATGIHMCTDRKWTLFHDNNYYQGLTINQAIDHIVEIQKLPLWGDHRPNIHPYITFASLGFLDKPTNSHPPTSLAIISLLYITENILKMKKLLSQWQHPDLVLKF